MFFSQPTLQMSDQLKARRLSEARNHGVVSTDIGMWKCEGLESLQCDCFKTKLPGKENIIISKTDQ